MNEEEQKEVAYYQAVVQTWFSTRVEHDKNLLSLSAGGIGLLVTLFTAIGIKTDVAFVIFSSAVISFVACVIIILSIFSRNAEHLEKIITENEIDDEVLKYLDKAAKSTFILGVILTAILGITTAFNNLNMEKNMSDKKSTSGVVQQDSIVGAGKIKPSNVQKHSIEGASKLRPQNQGNSGSNKEKKS